MTGVESSGSKVVESSNFDDPLYLHPSDTSVVSIINFKLTGTENYRIWRSSMIRALKGRNKVGFVDGTFAKPKDDETKLLKWDRVNAIVCSWLLNSISESIYSSHACCDLASEVWSDLYETYHKADGSVIFHVHQQINSLTQSGLSVSEYYNKLDGLWKEFDGLTNLTECTCAASTQFNDHTKLMKLMQFLNGLDDSFNQVKSHILLTDPLPNVKTAFAIVSREESNQRGGSSSSVSTNKSQPTAFFGKLNDQKRGKLRNPNLQCKHCGAKGHTIERCYKLIGFPKDFKSRSDSQNNTSFSGNKAVGPPHSLNNSDTSCTINVDKVSLSVDEYSKFLKLIGDKQGKEDVNANMAGTFFLSCNSVFSNNFNKK